jgi:hypothetical protein
MMIRYSETGGFLRFMVEEIVRHVLLGVRIGAPLQKRRPPAWRPFHFGIFGAQANAGGAVNVRVMCNSRRFP